MGMPLKPLNPLKPLKHLKPLKPLKPLTLNLTKTKYMIFKNKQKTLTMEEIPQHKINNLFLERVFEYRYLGIYLDDSLSWSTHLNYIANKISKTNGLLNRLKQMLPKQILTTI